MNILKEEDRIDMIESFYNSITDEIKELKNTETLLKNNKNNKKNDKKESKRKSN